MCVCVLARAHIMGVCSIIISYTQLTKKTDTFFVIGITCDPYELKLVSTPACS